MSKLWLPNVTKADLPVYMVILNALEHDIVSGTLRPGDRLPTHRELASRLNLAIGTVTKAYREAERQGLIWGDGRRGTFVAAHSYPHASPNDSPRSEPGVIDLSSYHPFSETDPDLRLALAELATRNINHLVHYTGPRGYANHRAAGAQWIRTLGLSVSPDDIIITGGAQHAILVTLLALSKPGDVIAAARHTYTGVIRVAELLGLKLVGVETDREGLLPDAFETVCRKHRVKFLYCVPSLDNPTNAVLSEPRCRAIARTAERFGVRVIEDEINRRLLLKPPPLISSIVPHRTYLIASLSKVVAGGLRICYLFAPEKSREKIFKAVQGSTLTVSPLAAELAALWIGNGTTERSVLHKRVEAQKRTVIAEETLGGLEYSAHPCSYSLWLRLPPHWRTGEFAAEALRRGVIVVPADAFAVDADNSDRAVRICLGGNTTTDNLRRGLRLISSILQAASGAKAAVL